MYIIAGLVLIIYLFLWFVSRRISVAGKGLKTTLRMGAWIYGKWKKREVDGSGQSRIKTDLKKLYPGEESEERIARYYAEKLGLILTVVFVGMLLGTVVFVKTDLEKSLQKGNVVERGDYQNPQKEIRLEAQIEGYPGQSFTLNVDGRVPDRETSDRLEKEFWDQLKKEALGENPSWNEVSKNLVLSERIEGYPFNVEWSSENLFVVDYEGNVKSLSHGEEEKVRLTATVTYHEWEWIHILEVTVVSPTEEGERVYLELSQMLTEVEEESRENAFFALPEKWQGKAIRWREDSGNNGLLLWLMTLAVGASVFFLKDKDLNTKVRERQKQLNDAYPGILRKLELYLRAGLPIRGALTSIAELYLQNRQVGGKEHPAYEELLHVCRELQMGITETTAYERLGIRCGSQEYVRLGALLSQNAVKGSVGLTERLREEAESVRKEQMQRNRQLGEEASTKLLVPMVMMLGIVMIMIMIPAFGNF